MATLWISVILLALIRNAASDFDPQVCSILTESYGLIPPPLPTNFEMRSAIVDHQEKYTAYEEMYFDYINERAKYKVLLDSMEYNYLFDYDTEQVVQWIKVHPGNSMKRDPLSHSCEAVNMADSPFSFIFGYQDWMYQRTKMFNSNQVLRYGGQYLYAANGTRQLDERGLQVNKFVGCLYDGSTDATMYNDYYFADIMNVVPSGGTPSSIVTGSDKSPLSVPVKLHVTGRQYVEENKFVPIDKTYSISWFKGAPQFEMDTFQIPPYVYCEGYRGRKDIPMMPRAFSTRVTITSFLIDTLGQPMEHTSSEAYEEIYYDMEKRLARRDFTPNSIIDTDIYEEFGSYTPVSTIYDFNQGLRYTINKPSGRCYIAPIQDNEYFDTEEQLLYRKLATPEEIFIMQKDNMEYKGKAFARDIRCDVWNGKHFHKIYNATFIKETYFSTDGWHEIADGMVEYAVPVRNVLIRKELDGEAAEGISTYNFYKFKAQAPPVAYYDIKSCVEQINHKRFAIELALEKETRQTIYKFKFFFLEAAQLYITNKTDLETPLRVQRLHLRRQYVDNVRVFLVFSLLDKVNLKNFGGVMGQSGKDLQGAINLLRYQVDDGKFVIQFKNPKTGEMMGVAAERGGFYTLTGSGNLTKTSLVPAREAAPENDEIIISTKETHERHEGMTSGHLALLGVAMLFIGVGIGIALMYLYIRMYGDRHIEVRIGMTPTATLSNAGTSMM